MWAILRRLQLNRSPSLCHHEETVPPDGVGLGGVWDSEVYDPGQTGNTVKINYIFLNFQLADELVVSLIS